MPGRESTIDILIPTSFLAFLDRSAIKHHPESSMNQSNNHAITAAESAMSPYDTIRGPNTNVLSNGAKGGT